MEYIDSAMQAILSSAADLSQGIHIYGLGMQTEVPAPLFVLPFRLRDSVRFIEDTTTLSLRDPLISQITDLWQQEGGL